MKTLQERFDEKYEPVTESGCWIWTGSVTSRGYGNILVNGKTVSAHRISYELHVGKIPVGDGHHGICVLHKCDVRCCVNPSHLFLGTHKDNMVDKDNKGRSNQVKGSQVGSAKLNEGDVRDIKRMLNQGCLQREIGKIYGVNDSTVSQIKTGRIWGHVEGGRQ